MRQRRRRISKFGSARNEIDGANHVAQAADRTHNFEGQLRNAIAEVGKRHAFEHHIRKTPIGGRSVRAFFGDDQRIRLLTFVPAINSDRIFGLVDLLAVRPDPAHIRDPTFAESDGKIGKVRVGRRR